MKKNPICLLSELNFSVKNFDWSKEVSLTLPLNPTKNLCLGCPYTKILCHLTAYFCVAKLFS